MSWERTSLQPLDHPEDAPGSKLAFKDARGGTVAVIVRWPGTLYRVFWTGGFGHEDFATESAAVAAVEKRHLRD